MHYSQAFRLCNGVPRRLVRNPRSWLGYSTLGTSNQSAALRGSGRAMADAANPKEPEKVGEKPLPKLSPAEFRQYNRMAEQMDYFHNHFRQTWNMLYQACESNKRPAGMSIRQFFSAIEQLTQQLTFHHTIEEQSIFPVLARKMPAFREELELLTQHKKIHEGLDKLEEYIGECRSGEKELRMGDLKMIMDSFGKVLWAHLDDEVKQLGAENMRKYWTLAEMRGMPM